MAENIFPEGIMYKKAHDNAPDWIKGGISIKVEDAVRWLQENQHNGWVNLDIKEAKSKHIYLSHDTYRNPNEQPAPPEENLTGRQKPNFGSFKPAETAQAPPAVDFDDSDIPF